MNLQQLAIVFEKLKAATTASQKKQILLQYKDNDQFRTVMKFVFDKGFTTGLTKKGLNKKISFEGVESIRGFYSIFGVMDHVYVNNTGSHRTLLTVQRFLAELDTQEEYDTALSILTKDLPIGISKSTLNKVYGSKFIYSHDVQKAKNYEPGKTKIKELCAITEKIDGVRGTLFIENGRAKILLRSGKEVAGMDKMLQEAIRFLPDNRVYDGEILLKTDEDLTIPELFRKTSGIVRSDTDPQKEDLQLVIFDSLPVDEFYDGKSKENYADRRDFLDRIKMGLDVTNTLSVTPVMMLSDKAEEIETVWIDTINKGKEGIMLNPLSGHYETKRTPALLRLKQFKTADLRCVGIKEGIRGNYCGSIVVEYKGNTVDVPGLKEHEKQAFWEDPSQVIGKIVEVKYFEESQNKDGRKSLRLPSFNAIRFDKDEVSY